MQKTIFSRFQLFAITFCVLAYPVSNLPVLAQEGEVEEQETSFLESTIVGEIDLSSAITINDLSIPTDQLELLVKPLTLEELQTEAAAWLLVLKNKVQEISSAEIAIKRENQAIQLQNDAIQAVDAAESGLAEAEAALKQASPGTPAYEQAFDQLEEQKQSLREAEQAVEAAIVKIQSLEEDQTIRAIFQNAENEERVNEARNLLEEAERSRENLTAGSAAYNSATEKIDALAQALINLETADENLEGTVLDSSEYKEKQRVANEARKTVMDAAAAISGNISPTSESEDGKAIEAANTANVLEEIDASLKAAEAEVGNTGGEAGAATKPKTGEQLSEVTSRLKAVSDAEADIKNQIVANITSLQEEQTSIVEQFSTILDALDRKGGDTTSYRTYIDAVSGIELDITDTEGLGIRFTGWLTSSDGGIRIAIGLLKFGGILLAAVVISPWLGRGSNTILARVNGISTLLREFVVMIVKRGTLAAGALLALASLGVSLGPVLAVLGGASFVLAFALQSNLGNFASGLMLLVNKPFDVGDEVKLAGYWAYVDSISLANTKLKDFQGNIVTLPNNTVWGGDIINYTHAENRKLGFSINIKFSQDMDTIYQLWMDITASHPKVLETPAPSWFPWSSQYDYCIAVSLTAWSKTDDYWTVYVDLLQALQQRIGELGIELAAPVQEVRVQPSSDMSAIAGPAQGTA